MKTLIITLNLMLCLTMHSLASGEQIILRDEAYIDDIPFNTEFIAKEFLTQQFIADTLRADVEEYVNDIPFDTHKILANIHSDSAKTVRFKPASESYINDIPFRTELVVNRYCYRKQSDMCRLINDKEISLKN